MNTWTHEKPQMFTDECLLATAVKIRNDWYCNLYEIKQIYFEDGYYWGILDAEDGVEWGDYDDLAAELYMIIQLPNSDQEVKECDASKAEQGTNVDNQKNNHEKIQTRR